MNQKVVPDNAQGDQPPVTYVTETQVACDGIDTTIGHPRVYLTLKKDTNEVKCPYCGRIFRKKTNKVQ